MRDGVNILVYQYANVRICECANVRMCEFVIVCWLLNVSQRQFEIHMQLNVKRI